MKEEISGGRDWIHWLARAGLLLLSSVRIEVNWILGTVRCFIVSRRLKNLEKDYCIQYDLFSFGEDRFLSCRESLRM